MRKVIVSNLMSLDGFFEDASKGLGWCVLSEEFFDYSKEMLRRADMLLFGRVTYEVMANYWPTAPPDELADQMNSLQKVVFSKSLKAAGWQNSRVVSTDPAEEVQRLKQEPGKDLVVLGSASVASLLLQHGVIDEYRIILQPVLLGEGTPLFQDFNEQTRLKLTGSESFQTGAQVLTFEAA